MKANNLLALLMILVVIACNKTEQQPVYTHNGIPTGIPLRTRSGEFLDSTYFVSDVDLSAYLHYKSCLVDKEVFVRRIDTIACETGEPLLYIINYDNGWDLLAADKRATLPLSSYETGELVLDQDSPLTFWINCLAEDVFVTRFSKDDSFLNQTVVDYNLNQWKAINSDRSLFDDIANEYYPCEQTRFDPIQWPYVGYYVLTDVVTVPVIYDFITHFIPTSWVQSGGYCNAYIPLKNDNSGNRAPAGCIAVASAQVLYYLHNHYGFPADAPTAAYCYGDIDDYDMDQDNRLSTAWASMDSLGTHPYVAMLIASAAKLSGTTFGNSVSLADFCALNTVFQDYDYSGSCSSYNDSIVKIHLISERPVIVGAKSSPNATIGHVFIIDGYRRHSVQTTYVYEWVWVNYDPNISYPKIPNQYEVSYTSPLMTEYYMNWGWNPAYNSIPFSAEGDWIMNVPNNSPHNYIYNRTLFSDYYFVGN